MATKKNPYEDKTGNVLPSKAEQWFEWVGQHGDTSLDHLSEGEKRRAQRNRERLAERMQAEGPGDYK
ncbi:hypothetical protein A6C57_27855 (plasmid) [Fibrella sp. ES10-3-2-2]